MSTTTKTNHWVPKTQFIEYRGHPGLSKFSDAYMDLQKAIEKCVDAIRNHDEKLSQEISWDVIRRKYPSAAAMASTEAIELINERADSEVEIARSFVIQYAAKEELRQAIGLMNHSALRRLSREFPDSARAKELNCRFNPIEKRTHSWGAYVDVGLPKGMTSAEYAAIDLEPLWHLHPFERDIALNNFICGVNLLKLALRIYLKLAPVYSKSRSLSSHIFGSLEEAQTFIRLIPTLREPFTQAEVDADLASL